ncbi:MAG: hypothetical protein Q9212_002085 [Teloschistes hypoglaucus]
MLSRGNSEASARLRRAKSSASIKTQRSSLESRVTDPFLAKEQALAAAHHAFGCASGSPRPPTETVSQPKAWSDEQSLTRSKSIRFAGPAAVPRRELPITMRAAPMAHVYENRRQSLYPKLKRHHSFVHGDDSAITTLPVHSEYVETRVASQPSSYRRLRKSKSMFNPYGISELIAPHSLTSQTRTTTRVTNDDPGQQKILTTSRLGRSFSFLRPNTERIPSTATFSKASRNQAVGLARDQYLRQLEQQRSGQQPGLGDTGVHRRPQRAFRKSVRTSSGNSNSSVADSTTSQLRERIERRGIGGQARKLSSSFKNRIKRVFNRSSEAEGTLPAQQLQATRPHFSETAKSKSPQISQRQAPDSLYDITPDRSSSQQRKVLHVLRKRGSRVGSFESSHGNEGVENDKSRVTSWADSTAANTVAIHQEPGRKRLSTVRENRVASLYLGSLPTSGSSQRKLSSSVTMPTFTRPGSPQMSGTARQVSNPTIQAQLTGAAVVLTPKVNGSPVSNPHIPENRPVGPMQEENTDPNPKRPLRESKSMFFPQITRIERTRTSPFRQAMHPSDRPQKPQPAIVVLDPIEGMKMAPSQPALSRNRDRSLTRTESLYSRSSSGNTPQPFGNSTSSARLEKSADDNLTTESLAIRLREREFPGITTAMSPTDESSADWGVSRIGSSILSNIRDSPKHSLDVVPYRKGTGHKREHAQIREDDTDVGRLQSSTNQLKDRPAGAHLSLADCTTIRHMASQPMIDRFPLMSMKPQANANIIELKPQGSPRVIKNSTMENENRHPDSQNSPTPAKSNVKHSRGDIVSAESSSRDLCRQDNGSKRDKSVPHLSPQNSSRWAFSGSAPHSRSSPERLARLRRMQSSNALRSPIIQSAIGPPPGHQEWEANQDVDGPVMLTADQGTKLTRNDVGQSPDSRRMVDIFLSKRGRPQSHVADDMVFI